MTYTDGTTQTLSQNFSDWFVPQRFPGETRAVKMAYRNLSDGKRDARPFYSLQLWLCPRQYEDCQERHAA